MTGWALLGLVLCNSLISTVCYGFMFDLLLHKKVSLKRMVLSFLAFVFSTSMVTFLPIRNSIIGTLNGLLSGILFIRFRYQTPVSKTLLWGFIMFIISIIDDLIGSLTLLPLLGQEMFDQSRNYSSFISSALLNILVISYVGVAALCIYLFRILFKTKKNIKRKKLHTAWLFIRPVLLILSDIIVFGQAMARINDQAVNMIWEEMISNYILMILLLIVSATYIVQDIHYIRQYRRNETLENEKQITDALLKNLRIFRHNTANMLYGFEGYILAGKTDQMQEYYKEIVHRCSLINNENIIMLQNIPSQAVIGLMLHHIDKINQAEIPITVYADKHLNWGRIRESVICEALGVLLDNAFEAAQSSPSPSISVEMRNQNESGSLEIIVTNSVDRTASIDFSATTKPGHAGIGLAGVQALLEKNGAFLNIRQVGQYVEAQILMDNRSLFK